MGDAVANGAIEPDSSPDASWKSSTQSPPSTVPEKRTPMLTADGLHKHSCVVCATRKIKCDRKEPCGNCLKARSHCLYRAPAPPRRRKKGAAQSDVLDRLKRAEDLLAQKQTGEENFNNIIFRVADINLEKKGQLINTNSESTRYLDNSMWIWLNDELRDIRAVLEEPEDDDEPPDNYATIDDVASTMLLGNSPRSVSLEDQHPSPVFIFQFWQLYLQNVHPLIKVLHAPTAQQLIIDAAGHLDNVPKPLECLMFSIYYLVTLTLEESECENIFKEARGPLLARYRAAAQMSLIRADYLTSYNFIVLQAYTLYLVAVRSSMQPAAMWALSGIAVRMAHRMGLHQDGEAHGLPIFEVEMRRRIWWEIIFFDSRIAQLSGTGGISIARGTIYKMPRNFNDSDLYPGMTNLPIEHEGITEMVHAQVRAEVGNFLISFPQSGSHSGTFDGSWQGVSQSTIPLADKDRLIDELEQRLRDKVISKCDPLVPNHLLAMTIAKAATRAIRFMAHHPGKYPQGTTADPKEQALLVDLCCAILECNIFLQTEPSLRRFAYFTRTHFQYMSIIFMLKLLRAHTCDAVADRGWDVIGRVFSLLPLVLPEAPRMLHNAICDLTLSAWDRREAALPGIAIPDFIKEWRILRRHRHSPQTDFKQSPSAQSTSDSASPYTITQDVQAVQSAQGGGEQVRALDFEMHPAQVPPELMNWDEWDNLLQDSSNMDAFNISQNTEMTGTGGLPLGSAVPPDFSNWGSSMSGNMPF